MYYDYADIAFIYSNVFVVYFYYLFLQYIRKIYEYILLC